MSADNYIAIRMTTDGLFAVGIEFMSGNYPLLVDESKCPPNYYRIFEDISEADDFADDLESKVYCEYGIQDFIPEKVHPLDIPYNEYDWDDNAWTFDDELWGYGGDYDDHSLCCDEDEEKSLREMHDKESNYPFGRDW